MCIQSLVSSIRILSPWYMYNIGEGLRMQLDIHT